MAGDYDFYRLEWKAFKHNKKAYIAGWQEIHKENGPLTLDQTRALMVMFQRVLDGPAGDAQLAPEQVQPIDHEVRKIQARRRDEFAMHASSEEIKILMAGLSPEQWEEVLGATRPANHSKERMTWDARVMAYCRYLIADAMIYERNRK